jgi:thioredoxin-related protein/cytochrome c2
MKLIIIYIVAFGSLLFAMSGEEVFEKKCASCHNYYIPQNKLLSNFIDHNNTELNLTAPTLNQLSFALKDQVGDRKTDAESQKFEIEEFIAEYLKNPDKKRGVIPQKINRFFKTMPSMKGQLSEEEIEAVTGYIYDYAEAMMIEHGVKRYSYEEALKLARKEGKIIMIEGYIPYCRFCMRMDREVMVEPVVKEALNKDFLLVKKNLLIEKLPLGMKRLGTPSFYFISSDGKEIIDMIEGFGTIDEFLELLKSIKEEAK